MLSSIYTVKKLCVFYHLSSAGISEFFEKGIPKNCQKNSHLSNSGLKVLSLKGLILPYINFTLINFMYKKGIGIISPDKERTKKLKHNS